MSKSKWGLKNPEKFIFVMPLEAAELFRNYCNDKRYVMGKVLVDLVIDHLIAEGVIDEQTALAIREGETVTPFTIERQKQRAHAFSVIEAATKEAEEFNSKQYKTGKQP